MAKNPTDSTTRNVKAGNKRDAKQDEDIRDLKRRMKHLERIVYKALGIKLVK